MENMLAAQVSPWTIVFIGIVITVIVLFFKVVRIVPQRSAMIVERLGKYQQTLEAGMHILVPFIDRVAYTHTLKEQAVDVPPQTCITKDNISVEVDGILYMQIVDPQRASYGINNYRFASIQLAQTTMRSVMGKLDLDKTFEERESINHLIVNAVDKASEPWGVKVTRYEVKNIVPPPSIKDAMEKQMKAEREKRATIAESEGYRQSQINRAEGEKQEVIAQSEAEKQKQINISEGNKIKQINMAEGEAEAILRVARAKAEGIREIALALNETGGLEAVNMRIAERYLEEFGKLAQTNNTMIIPTDLADIAGVVKAATSVIVKSEKPTK
ncbi:MAG: paraslipin [Sedimentisphaerales bacterium]|nr:paraslipin [Sedimentisphaerales bacterium]